MDCAALNCAIVEIDGGVGCQNHHDDEVELDMHIELFVSWFPDPDAENCDAFSFFGVIYMSIYFHLSVS